MVGSGMALVAISAAWVWARLRRREPGRMLLRAIALGGPLGFVALEAGWVLTESGRQPWAIHGILRTRDAVTPVSGVELSFAVFTLLYVGLAVATVAILLKLAAKPREGGG
jgi:cytochrome d ubiquinol oxidase subunit I